MGIGGAMDLAAGAKRILVLTTHLTKKGQPKLVRECNFPLTAKGVVSRVISDLGTFDTSAEGFRLVELAPGVTIEEVREKTDADVHA